jgi:hypothetical protein
MVTAAHGQSGATRRFVTIKADHIPCGTSAIALATMAVPINAALPGGLSF